MSKRAAEIAQAHIQKANPTLWDGTGNRPADFDSRIATYPIDQDTELDISFEYEKGDGWLHLCELRDKHTGELLELLHGYGIDSPLNLSDTIEDICDGKYDTEKDALAGFERTDKSMSGALLTFEEF